MGFTVATLILFALSITAIAVVLEQVSAQRSRAAAELDVARRIQTRILPGDTSLRGLDVACHMRSAESVGGDYFDIQRIGDETWFLLGDVTGHGLGAGLVMLMAQSTISAILETRPDITPRALNYTANRVLARNLARLDERRHMTVVSLRRGAVDGQFMVSGSHENLFVYRAGQNDVEAVSVDHFPWGLGFLGDLREDEFREDAITLVAGDVLFMGTDGIIEAARGGEPRQGLFGEERLTAFLRANGGASVAEIKQRLLNVLDAFTEGRYHDDVAFIVMRMSKAAS